MTIILKVWLAAAFMTVAIYYLCHSVNEIREAASLANQRSGVSEPKP